MAEEVSWCHSRFSTSVPWLNNEFDSDDEILLLYSVCKTKRKWVHQINEKRNDFGEYHHLMSDLDLDDERFKTYFRLSREQFDDVLKLIEGDIKKQDTNYRPSIKSKERLAICLRHLSTGDSFTTISFSYRIGISTVSKIINEVCDAIWTYLQPIYMPEPDQEMWTKIENGFCLKWSFPHCIGCIDGKHCAIKAPPNSGSEYFNYKKFYSVVLLGLVDADYKFIAIDCGSYGKENDSTIFAESHFGKRYLSYSMAVPPDEPIYEGGRNLPYVILGDEGFALKRNVMRPFPRDNLNNERRIFNYRHCHCRRVVENAFGILAQRWRIFFRPMNCSMDTVVKIIKATTVLHNYLSAHQGTTSSAPTSEEIHEQYRNCWKPVRYFGSRATKEAVRVRETFMEYFNSEQGEVRWQWQHL